MESTEKSSHKFPLRQTEVSKEWKCLKEPVKSFINSIVNPAKLEENEFNKYQSKRMKEFMMDDKIYFFDTDRVYIVNWIDFSEWKEIQRDIDENKLYEGKAVL